MRSMIFPLFANGMEEDWDDYVVSSYAFDESLLEHPSLRVKVFTEPTEEWALFILANRKGLETQLYDIVVGPITDL